MQSESVTGILKRYEGQDVFIVIEVLDYNPKTSDPLTERLIGVTPDEDEAWQMTEGLKCAMVR